MTWPADRLQFPFILALWRQLHLGLRWISRNGQSHRSPLRDLSSKLEIDETAESVGLCKRKPQAHWCWQFVVTFGISTVKLKVNAKSIAGPGLKPAWRSRRRSWVSTAPPPRCGSPLVEWSLPKRLHRSLDPSHVDQWTTSWCLVGNEGMIHSNY